MTYKHSRKYLLGFIERKQLSGGGMYDEDVEVLVNLLLEKAEWPQEGDRYRSFNGLGEIHSFRWCDDTADRRYKAFGNCFRTKKEAIKARDKIKSLLRKVF